jgi:hypothetical protein
MYAIIPTIGISNTKKYRYRAPPVHGYLIASPISPIVSHLNPVGVCCSFCLYIYLKVFTGSSTGNEGVVVVFLLLL